MTTVTPTVAADRRRRLEEMLAFAQTFRGWTARQLGRALERDPSNLVPDSGVPKVDLVARLASIIGWSVDDLVHELVGSVAMDGAITDALLLDPTAREAMAARADATELDDEPARAHACLRECGAWSRAGRFTHAIEAARRGLESASAPAAIRLRLTLALADACASTGRLVEATALAGDAARRALARDGEPGMLALHARACAVRGHCTVERGVRELDGTSSRSARADLQRARGVLESDLVLADDADAAGHAHRCGVALLELDVLDGDVAHDEALERIMRELDEATPPDAPASAIGSSERLDRPDRPDQRDTPQDTHQDGDAATAPDDRALGVLRSLGWWCASGCRIALRGVTDEALLHRALAILTTKGHDLADRTDDWALRAAFLRLDYERRERLTSWTGVADPLVIDEEDVRLIVGCIGGNPSFRATGLRLLRTARVISGS